MATVGDIAKASAIRLTVPDLGRWVGNPDPGAQEIIAAMMAAADDLVDRYPIKRQVFGGLWLRDVTGKKLLVPSADTEAPSMQLLERCASSSGPAARSQALGRGICDGRRCLP